MRLHELTEADHELIRAALNALEKNFDDGIYHHTVGAAVRTKEGKIYAGVNMGGGVHGSCAEYTALGMALSQGEREFDSIVAVHDRAPNCLVSPCGNCRQMLIEYCPDVMVILNDDSNNMVKVSARDLLPFAWRPVVVEDE